MAATDEDISSVTHVADQAPFDVFAQLRAAYECDKLGEESRALWYYEKALSLAIPEGEKKKFAICYGSTLKNVGRLDDALSHLREASLTYPENSEVWAFLSLALRASGRTEEAHTCLLRALVIEAGEAGLGGFSGAIAGYLEELQSETALIP